MNEDYFLGLATGIEPMHARNLFYQEAGPQLQMKIRKCYFRI